jgi:exodeoxyribonuclease VII small subunit
MPENSSKKKSKQLNFEKALKRLEEIVQELEEGNPPLQKALALFQEGKNLGRLCNKELTGLEQKVQKILEDEEGNITLEDFKPKDDSDR